ncbi:MAG: hypothetical protein AAGE84_21125 [Cyanobacteria bacterium P01_G01_bin.39]
MSSLMGSIITCSSDEILLFKQMKWSWNKAKSRIILNLLFSVVLGLILDLMMDLSSSSSIKLDSYLVLALCFGLILILNNGFSSLTLKQRTFPNQGIWRSMKNFVWIGLFGGFIFGLLMSFSFVMFSWLSGGLKESWLFNKDKLIFLNLMGGYFIGLFFMIIGGLKNGGASCIQHFNLRQILFCKGRIPWNYAHFLKYATKLHLMKKVGGGYIFYHRMLMEHFAQMEVDK